MFLTYQLHKVLVTNTTFDLDFWPTDLEINRDHVLIMDGLATYQVWSFWVKAFLTYQLHEVLVTNMTFDLDFLPTDLKINRNHLLIEDYLPTKFEASGANPSWVISCTRLRETDIPTNRPTDWHVRRNMAFSKGYNYLFWKYWEAFHNFARKLYQKYSSCTLTSVEI